MESMMMTSITLSSAPSWCVYMRPFERRAKCCIILKRLAQAMIGLIGLEIFRRVMLTNV